MNTIERMKLAAIEGAAAYQWGARIGKLIAVLMLLAGVAISVAVLILSILAACWAMGRLLTWVWGAA